MPDGPADAFLPPIREAAVRNGVRWSRRVGYPGIDGLVALATHPLKEGVVLGCQDSSGTSTAVSLTPGEAVAFRDALSAYLEGRL